MKKNNIIKGVVAFSFLALLAGGVIVAKAANAATTPVGPVGRGRGAWHLNVKNLTAAQKIALEAEMAANLKAREARQAAVKAAITSNDYNAWVTAVGANSPIVSKITAANFSQYVQAYNLRQQADQIMKSLGLGNHGEGLGLGLGIRGMAH